MNLIFYGFLVMLLRVNVNGVSLAPLFQIGGYALVMQGMQAIDKVNKFFKRALPLVYALIVLNALVLIMDFGGMSPYANVMSIVMGIVGLIAVYNVLKGIHVFHDQLQTPNLTTKMYKRWRWSMVFFVVGFGVALVAFIVLITFVPFADLWQLILELMADPTAEDVAFEIGLMVAPIAGLFVGLLRVFVIMLITSVVFYIMFLVALYNVQKEFALRTPTISTPTDFPNPQ